MTMIVSAPPAAGIGARIGQSHYVRSERAERIGRAADRIDSEVQRKLVDNIQLAQSLGAEIVKLRDSTPSRRCG